MATNLERELRKVKRQLRLTKLDLVRSKQDLYERNRIDARILYRLTKADVDCCITVPTTNEEREACYEAVRDLDSSLIFDQIGALIEQELSK